MMDHMEPMIKNDDLCQQAQQDVFTESMITAIACKREIDRLADWIMANIPHEIGNGTSESAVDVAIRLMSSRGA
jgi:hypothetical protein